MNGDEGKPGAMQHKVMNISTRTTWMSLCIKQADVIECHDFARTSTRALGYP